MGRHVSFLLPIKIQKNGPGAKVFVQLTEIKERKKKQNNSAGLLLHCLSGNRAYESR